MKRRLPLRWTALLALCSGSTAFAEDWPSWRGPLGNGVSTDKKLPLEWGKEKNVLWRVELPGPGNASPIVWGDRVFVAQAVANEKRRTLMCFNRKDGKLLWQSGVNFEGDEPTHQTNPYCAGTPATDGKIVYVCFGTPGVYAYDFEGKEVWHRDLGSLNHMFGSAVSPVLYGDLCILNFGPTEGTKLVALDKASGKTVWEQTPPAVDPSEQGPPRGPGGRGPGGPGGFGPGAMLAPAMLLQGDKDEDNKLSKSEFMSLADRWFDKLDSEQKDQVNQEQFLRQVESLLPPPEGGAPPQGRGGPGRFIGPGLFSALDTDKDGTLTRSEMKSTFEKWSTELSDKASGLMTEQQLRDGLSSALPQPNFAGGPGGGPGRGGPGGGPGGPGGPGGGRGGRGFGGGGGASWSTPTVVHVDDHDELILNFPARIVAYDPKTGKQLWMSKGVGTTIYTTPVWGEGVLVASSSGMGEKNAVAVRPGGNGDVTESSRVWQLKGIGSQMGSGVIHQGHLYSVTQDGVASCVELSTGKEVWEKRLRGSGGQGGCWSSMMLANDTIYLPNQSGDVFVLRASPTFELLATNSVEESTNASLAASEGDLFFRTNDALWCLRAK